MKKICFISLQAFPLLANFDACTHGGAELQFKILAQNFVERGIEVHFIVDDCGQNAYELIDGINIHKVSMRYMGGKNKYLIFDWFHFVCCLYRINADCYLIKTPRHLLFPLGLWGKFSHKKIVFIGQIDDDADKFVLREKDGFLPYWFYVIGMRWVDYTIAQNKFQFQGFTRCYGKNSYIIRNVLSLPVKKNITKQNYILWVGNNLPKKHPELFLDLAETLPQYNFRMIMSTTSQYPVDDSLRKRASDISNLDYMGAVPFKRIDRYFEGAKLFVGTSDLEGFPNTYLQAWQYKIPVISLYIDPDNVIKDKKLGRCSQTFLKLCEDVSVFMEDAHLLNVTARKCTKYVKKNHSVESIVQKYMNILNI